jgi:uncharacterized protein (TIGR00251 family)
MIRIDEKNGSVIFRVRVQPNARREGIDGEWDGALRIRVAAPPIDDRANEAVVELLAARLKRPQAAVRIIGGAKSRLKRIAVQSVAANQVRALLEVSREKQTASPGTGMLTARRKTDARHSGDSS